MAGVCQEGPQTILQIHWQQPVFRRGYGGSVCQGLSRLQESGGRSPSKKKRSDVNDLERLIAEQKAEDPSFAETLAESESELELGMKIAALREERGWTQEQLADRVGMPQSSVARYERAARTPSLGTLWRLATALDAEFVIGPRFSVRFVPSDITSLTIYNKGCRV